MNAESAAKADGEGAQPAISDVALRAIAANAVRHLLEADQHYKGGRFPSATASAVLSIEEAGKLTFVMTRGPVPTPNRHAVHAILFVGLLKALGQWSWTAQWVKILRDNVDLADLRLTDQQQQDVAAHPEIAQFLRRVQTGELSDATERLNTWAAAVIAKEQREGTYQFWESLFTRGLQAIRLKATYVDLTPAGDIRNEPSTIDGDFGKFMCAGAVGFLIVALLLAVHTRNSLEVRDLLDTVPDDVAGLDMLRTLFPSLSALTAKAVAEVVSKATA